MSMWQSIPGGIGNPVHVSATENIGLRTSQLNLWNTNWALRRQMVASDGRFLRFHVKLDAAPASSGTYTFSLRKNNVDAGLSVAIIDPATEGSNYGESNAFAPYDKAGIQCVPTGTPGNTPRAYWCITWWDDAENRAIVIFGINDAMGTVAAEINHGCGGERWAAPVVGGPNVGSKISVAGTMMDYHGQINSGAGAGASKGYEMTLQVDGVASGVGFNLKNGTTFNADTTNTKALAVGNSIRQLETPTSSPTARYFFGGWVFQTDEAYAHPIQGGSNNGLSTINGAVEYNTPDVCDFNWHATQSLRILLVDCATISHLYVELHTAPTTGNDYTFTLMLNGADTALEVTIADTATGGSDTTNHVEVEEFDEISLRCTSTGATLASAAAIWGYKARSNLLVQNSGMMMGAGI